MSGTRGWTGSQEPPPIAHLASGPPAGCWTEIVTPDPAAKSAATICPCWPGSKPRLAPAALRKTSRDCPRRAQRRRPPCLIVRTPRASDVSSRSCGMPGRSETLVSPFPVAGNVSLCREGPRPAGLARDPIRARGSSGRPSRPGRGRLAEGQRAGRRGNQQKRDEQQRSGRAHQQARGSEDLLAGEDPPCPGAVRSGAGQE